jgi:hypothetical protein
MDTHATRIRSWRTVVVLAALAVSFLMVLSFANVAQASTLPAFCSTCHATPAGTSVWHNGAHKGLACAKCHVRPASEPRLQHKVMALRAIADHVLGRRTASAPPIQIPQVPEVRCTACHPNVVVNIKGFSHALHERGRACTQCHDATGRSLTPAQVQAARANTRGPGTVTARRVSYPGTTPATAATGHLPIDCSKCHDLGTTACASCHALPAKHSATPVAACSECHASGKKWVFAHPARQDCQTCHATPTKHVSIATDTPCTKCHTAGPKSWAFSHKPAAELTVTDCAACHVTPAAHRPGACATCHRKPGVSWAFSHVGLAACASCHKPPANHRAGTCTKCHRVAASWKFVHPGSSACGSCHARPANHRSGSCATCHRLGSWRFVHSGSSACGSCHRRPANHSSGSCATCHRVGSWRFVHSGSGACRSCHRAPANHFGTSCASCHSPSRAWANASFRHPSAGEHSYRSFACSRCHPSGPPRVNCTCHKNGTAGGGD